jgi:hypothetical protein
MVWDLVYLGKIFSYPSQRATSCCLYKHRSRPIEEHNNRINTIYFFSTFALVFLFFLFFLRLDLLAATTTPWVVMDLVPPLVRRQLARRRMPSPEPMMPLTAAGPDEIGPSSLPNRSIRFALCWARASVSCPFCVQTWLKIFSVKSTQSRSIRCTSLLCFPMVFHKLATHPSLEVICRAMHH